jgi:hypothetical protein
MPKVLCLFCAEPQRWICGKCLHCEGCCECKETEISYIESRQGTILRRRALTEITKPAPTLTRNSP